MQECGQPANIVGNNNIDTNTVANIDTNIVANIDSNIVANIDTNTVANIDSNIDTNIVVICCFKWWFRDCSQGVHVAVRHMRTRKPECAASQVAAEVAANVAASHCKGSYKVKCKCSCTLRST